MIGAIYARTNYEEVHRMADDNLLAGLIDERLVTNAFNDQGGSDVEMMQRLKNSIEAQMQAANTLSGKIHRLNQSLLLYTIAIAIMAAFQFGAWLRDLVR